MQKQNIKDLLQKMHSNIGMIGFPQIYLVLPILINK